VILVFGIASPADKLARTWAQVDDADKARGIAKIRIMRKLAQMQDATNQIHKKAAEFDKAQKQLQDAKSVLETKHQSKESAEAEIHALTEQVHQHTGNVRKYSEEVDKVKAQSDQFSDELEIEKLNMEAFSKSIDELHRTIDLWGWMTCGSIIVGGVMMSLGFREWYYKVQVYQNAILRKQAGEIEKAGDEASNNKRA
jgi:predicted nuclease with TOPRIM domain